MACLAGVLLCLGPLPAPAQDLPEWVLNLARLKRQARANFERLPNYACKEAVTRMEKAKDASAYRQIDKLYLEVAVVNGKELFALEGAPQFDTENPLAFIDRGAIGSGSFAAIAHNLFMGGAARTTAWGEDERGGRKTLWYDYQIPAMFGAYLLQSGPVKASVGEEGRFFVDAGTLDLIRIASRATDVPPAFPIQEVSTTIEYAKTQIGGAEVILPRLATTDLTMSGGRLQRNVAEYSGCREYTSESTIRFEDPPPESTPARRKP